MDETLIQNRGLYVTAQEEHRKAVSELADCVHRVGRFLEGYKHYHVPHRIYAPAPDIGKVKDIVARMDELIAKADSLQAQMVELKPIIGMP